MSSVIAYNSFDGASFPTAELSGGCRAHMTCRMKPPCGYSSSTGSIAATCCCASAPSASLGRRPLISSRGTHRASAGLLSCVVRATPGHETKGARTFAAPHTQCTHRVTMAASVIHSSVMHSSKQVISPASVSHRTQIPCSFLVLQACGHRGKRQRPLRGEYCCEGTADPAL